MAHSGQYPKPDGSLTYQPAHEINVGFCLMWAKTIHRFRGVNWWATTTPEGPAVVAFRITSAGAARADAWGPGTPWALDQFPALLGANDDTTGFRPLSGRLAEIAERFPNPRIGSTCRWYEALATIAIGQRVVRADAQQSRTKLSRRYGTVFADLPVAIFPGPSAVLAITDHEFHRAGIERSRARVVRVAAKHAEKLEALHSVSSDEAEALLLRLPGVGPWTAGLSRSIAAGDPDAVPTGDLHLPRLVTLALSGEEGDDSRMLELLEPYRGHRMRVIRMIKMSGAGPARRMPQPTRQDISNI